MTLIEQKEKYLKDREELIKERDQLIQKLRDIEVSIERFNGALIAVNDAITNLEKKDDVNKAE